MLKKTLTPNFRKQINLNIQNQDYEYLTMLGGVFQQLDLEYSKVTDSPVAI